MNAWKILLFTILILVVPIGVAIYLELDKPVPVSVVLKTEFSSTNAPNQVSITKESLEELSKTIDDNMLVKDQSRLIETFTQEKTNYTNLLTVISVLLTVFSLFALLSSFIDRGEFQKLANEMQVKISAYDKEFGKLQFNSLIADMRRHQGYFNSPSSILIFEDGTRVSDRNTFMKYFSQTAGDIFLKAREKGISEHLQTNTFYIEYFNFLIHAISYSNQMNYDTDSKVSVSTNEIFRTGVSLFSGNLGTEALGKMKGIVNVGMTIDWGTY